MIDTHAARLRLFAGSPTGIGPEVGQLPAPSALEVTLDIDRSPYVQGRFTIPRAPRYILELLDPRTFPVVEVLLQRSTSGVEHLPATLGTVSADLAGGTLSTASSILKNADDLLAVSDRYQGTDVVTRWTPGTEQDDSFKSWFLYVTDLVESYADDTLTVTLSSGEFRLDDHKRIAPDILEVAYLGPDARTVIGELIKRVGGTLQWAGGRWPWTGETTYWHPGQSLSELIDPVLEQGGVRIYAESATDYTIAAIGEHSGFGTTSHIDLTADTDLFRADRELSTSTGGVGWYDAALVIYQWATLDGEQRTAYDRYPVSGANTRARVVTRNAAYPGAGAAQGIVGRSAQRGYSISVSTASNYFLNPGWSASLQLPDDPAPDEWSIKTVGYTYPAGEMALTLQSNGT